MMRKFKAIPNRGIVASTVGNQYNTDFYYKHGDEGAYEYDWNIASSPSFATPGELARLAHSPMSIIREEVASNSKTSVETLKWLLNDPDADVRAAAKWQLNDRGVLASKQIPIVSADDVGQHIISKEDGRTLEDVCEYYMDYVNDSDPNWEYNTPESFGGAVVRAIERNLGVDLTPEEIDYVYEKASHGDFDMYDENW